VDGRSSGGRSGWAQRINAELAKPSRRDAVTVAAAYDLFGDRAESAEYEIKLIAVRFNAYVYDMFANQMRVLARSQKRRCCCGSSTVRRRWRLAVGPRAPYVTS
jgi:hypothetical protein